MPTPWRSCKAGVRLIGNRIKLARCPLPVARCPLPVARWAAGLSLRALESRIGRRVTA